MARKALLRSPRPNLERAKSVSKFSERRWVRHQRDRELKELSCRAERGDDHPVERQDEGNRGENEHGVDQEVGGAHPWPLLFGDHFIRSASDQFGLARALRCHVSRSFAQSASRLPSFSCIIDRAKMISASTQARAAP